MNLTWLAPLDSGTTAINGYEYHKRMSSETAFGDWTDTGNGTTLNKLVDGLTFGTSYVFEVRAKNSAGSGHISNSATATVLTPVLPSAPSWIIADPGDGEVPLMWDTPSSFGTTPRGKCIIS